MKINTGNSKNQQQNGSISLSRLGGQTPPQQTEPTAPTSPYINQQAQPTPPSFAANTQGVNLKKGQNVSLSKNNVTLDAITVGLGWDMNGYAAQDFDLDSQVFMLGANEKVISDQHFIFYNNRQSPDGSVTHMGDNKTGAGSGDDEMIQISLSRVPQQVQKIIFTATIYEGKLRNQTFGQIRNAFIRIVDRTTGMELVRYDLTESFSVETALVAGELYRYQSEWKFRAIGSGYTDDLADFCYRYGVQL